MAARLPPQLEAVDIAMSTWAREIRDPMPISTCALAFADDGVQDKSPALSDQSADIDSILPRLWYVQRTLLERYYRWNDPVDAICRRCGIRSRSSFYIEYKLALSEMRGELRSRGYRI
jgi:hypothetical protein